MLVIELYKFNKKPNSTSRPSAPFITCENCLLMDDTSIINPRIAFRFGLEEAPIACNYAYIPEFKRYYFVNDWTWHNGQWIALFNCDVMASYKTEIGDSTQYVLRNATTYNESIIDTFYPARCGCDIQKSEMENPFVPVFGGGSYVLGIINSDNNSTGVGAISYYVLTPAQFAVFREKLLGNVEWFNEGISDISEDLAKTLFNPFQYISSCLWFPFTITGTSVNKLSFGWWNIDVPCSRLPGSGVQTFGSTIATPKHPQSTGKAYLNDSPFSQYRFDWPCVGCVAIEPKYLYSVPHFGYICQVDLVTGGATIELKALNGDLTIDRTITILSSQIGVPIRLAQISADYFGNVASVAGGNFGGLLNAGAAMFSSLLGGNSASAIGNAVDASFASVQSSGTNGSASAFFLPPVLQGKFLRVVDDMPVNMGRPLCAAKQISTLSGFTLCQSSRIEIPGTYEEASSIIDYMNGGFFYE